MSSTYLNNKLFVTVALLIQRIFPIYCFYTYQITCKKHKILYIIHKHNKKCYTT